MELYNYKRKVKIFDSGYVATPLFHNQDNDSYFDITEININEKNRIYGVTSIAAITRGKTSSNNPEKRYKSFFREAVGNTLVDNKGKRQASRVLEFIPVVCEVIFNNSTAILLLKDNTFTLSIEEFSNLLAGFSYLHKKTNNVGNTYKLYTNMRALINLEVPYEFIPYNNKEDLKDYKLVFIKTPHFVFDQIYTHTQLSKIAVSNRVVDESSYWLPTDIISRLKSNKELYNSIMDIVNRNYILVDELNNKIVLEIFLNYLSSNKVKNIFKHLKYKKEIYNRWSYGMLYSKFYMGGWSNDPKRWFHFLLEREAYPEYHKSWVLNETRVTAEAIREAIDF